MVQGNPETAVGDEAQAGAVDDASRSMTAAYDDFELLATGDVDTFVLDLNELPGPPPYFIVVDGRRFALQRETFLVRGHGATLPQWLREQEVEGRLVLLAERDERYLVYVHDPNAVDEDGDDGE
jgi:hypothetical protein